MSTIPGFELGDLLQESTHLKLYRALREADGYSCLIKTVTKEYPSRQSLSLLRREYRLLNQLQSIRNIIKTFGIKTYGNGNIAIILEDIGEPLIALFNSDPKYRMSISKVVRLGKEVAHVLGDIHEDNIIHNNISPYSIFIGPDGSARLAELELHSELAYENSNQIPVREIAGYLPYISPEQTGRINRNIDYRSDYYSLGITLYQLLTGILPIQASSPLEWVHRHISRTPRSPQELDPSIPANVSDIVMKLLAKNADERYQSSHALISDFECCQDALVSGTWTQVIRLGKKDVSQIFQIPQYLVGRDEELRVIRSVFEKTINGATEFCMVIGYSGIGKSALVNELCKPLFLRKGFLLRGKYDQFQRSVPFSGISLALRSLIPQLLELESDSLQQLTEELRRALEPNEAVLTNFIPELEEVLGSSENSLPELPGNETQNRFYLALLNLLRVIAKTRPLIIFLDDLQFADSSSMEFLNRLSSARNISKTLLIGAYRSNEVKPGHPLQVKLNEIGTNRTVHRIELGPLEGLEVNQLIAKTLHTDTATCKELGKIIHEKSHGNPFSIQEMLRTMYRMKSIRFVHKQGRWGWDLEAIRNLSLTENIVDLVISNLRKLPSETQRILQRSACIGNVFDLLTLSQIMEQGMEEINTALLAAMKQQVVIPINNDYKLFSQLMNESSASYYQQPLTNPTYRFLHDKVQQAAYELSSQHEREHIHYSVGSLLLKHACSEELEENPIRLVDHLNKGSKLIADSAERMKLVELNLAAGIQAQRSGAYESALQYLSKGMRLGSEETWQRNYSLALSLAIEYQQCAYLTARYEEADHWIENLLKRCRTDLERAKVLSMRTRQYSTTGKMEASIEAAIQGLALLGVEVTLNPDAQSITNEQAAIRRNLRGRAISELIDSPAVTDTGMAIAIRLLMEIFPAAFLSGSGRLFPYVVLKAVNLSLLHGNSRETAFTYAAYGMLLCGSLEKPALGLEFGTLAVKMNERSDDITLKSRVIYVYAMFVHHWSHSWASMTEWFRRGIEAGYQSGDLLYLAYSAQDCVIWDPTLDLETAEKKHQEYLNIVKDCEYQDSLDSGTLFLQLQRNLLGKTADLLSLNDDNFDEDSCLAGMRQRRFMTGVANYHIYKAEICYLYRDIPQALVHIRAQDALRASAMSLPQLVRFELISFLSFTACFLDLRESEQQEINRRLQNQLKRMSRWARHCPTNFLHLKLMMEGEIARIQRKPQAALNRFKHSMVEAHSNGFIRDEAFANELASRNLIDWGRPKEAEGYLRAAHSLFYHWCAHRKVNHLEREFTILVHRGVSHHAFTQSGALTANQIPEAPTSSDSLDMDSVIKASHTISSEIHLEQLLPRTMRILLENAGCQLGCFVLSQEGQLVEAARTDMNQDEATGPLAEPSSLDPGTLPVQVIQQVLQSGIPFVLNDAPQDPVPFGDPYLATMRPRSVLCLPMTRQNSLGGVIYMENRVASGVITPSRIEVIRLLAAQSSISIENARLYQDQQRLIQAQKRFVPNQFLHSLEHPDISTLALGQHVSKIMSIIFADLRGFTPLAEMLGASESIKLLNDYFSSMEKPINSCGGFIDSYSGDQIMALFEVSVDCAVKAALEMFKALDELNADLNRSGRPTLRMGIGLNTGPLVLGTVGGGHRIQCSVIGDTVNTASRVEQLTKTYGSRILMSEESHRNLISPELVRVRRVDQAIVRGKDKRVNIYEVLDADDPKKRVQKLKTHCTVQAGIDAFLGGERLLAQNLFEQAREIDPDDDVSAIFLKRLQLQSVEGSQPKQGD